MVIQSHSVKDTLNIGKRIGRHLCQVDIICLCGNLVAGKTVLTKGIAEGLGIDREKVISSSFVLIRQHTQGVLPLYHFDLYRLNQPQDILALGYEEYLYNEGVAVIEWADKLEHLLPKEFLKVELTFKDESQRMLKFIPVGRRYNELMERVHEDIRH
ncbi:MAG: tRNA (adenosine(37)-N6)-threonylcarbamoyltransferase complex ATPase subunit type 1 TsaE [Candidatus Omnitrophica bacterium]|nr:tRNA (adenosine(37)-N6)-threonylcarbamoyltransferase complex ATPase subunit type 1 TsaE [Candidatus Omnitrophota bacterium]